MIAMLQKKWKNLPAALRTVLTLLAVLALAALLATVRHNASAYRTGVWDTGSQTLIYGRMHQMEQGQRAPGGFLGVYTEDWSDDQNRSWFREDTPADAAQFRPYTHQSGLQGWALGGMNRLLRVFLPEGTARETALYWVNSTLFYAVQLLTALAVWQELGVLPAAFWMAAILLAPWLHCLSGGGKKILWHPIKHYRTIHHHKMLVMKNCFRCGLYWQGLTHDLSKLAPVEFWAGAKYWQGTCSPNNAQRQTEGYSAAWLHHKGRNKHHLEYWIDYAPNGDHAMAGMRMPERYVAEMVCDRIAASKNYKGASYTDAAAWEYYDRSKDHYILHPETRRQLETCLLILRDEGEDACFAYIRKELLGKKK